ncbi:MAG: biotin transporter BioY [Candidatus Omnitrophica bacterium]|nr:biotin transporter BioY [Candidatus Omnitrophota bacterium]
METILNREIIVDKTICRIINVSVFVILTSLGAFVRMPLPFTPIPITLQTLFVLLSGAILGSGLGALSQSIYLLLGGLGLPIFAGAGSGFVYLVGPTGGYLAGFVLAALFIGRFISKTKSILSVFILFCLADFIILTIGTLWLGFVFRYNATRSILFGFLPFVLGDIFKASVASFVYIRLRGRLKEIL